MDSKNSNNNGEDGQQQLRRSSRIRKLNKLANDGKPAEGEVQTEPQNCSSSKNNRKKDRNHLDLEIVLPQENAEREIADETEEQAKLPKPMISLGKFKIDFPMNGNAPENYSDGDMEWPQPDVPMPSNIANFQEIYLCFFDESVLNFLRQFQLNSLLSNVNLEFKKCKSAPLMAFLTKFMPLIQSVDSITDTGQSFVSLLKHSPLANTLLTSARVFDILILDTEDALIGNWLTTPRPDGKPRLLFLKPYRYYDFFRDQTELDYTCSPFIEYIKLEFMQAKQAASFYIKIVCFDDLREVLAPLSLQNIQTGEKLVITKIMGEHPRDVNLTISRIPIGANEEEWHNEMAQYSDSNSDNRWDNVGQYAKKEYRNIVIDI